MSLKAKRQRAAMTLLETIVSLALSLLLLGLVVSVMRQIMGPVREGIERGESYFAASGAMRRVCDALSAANAAGIAIFSPAEAKEACVLTIDQQQGVSEGYQAVFGAEVQIFFFKPSTKELLSRRLSPPEVELEPLIPFRPSSEVFSSLIANPAKAYLVLAPRVTRFEVANLDSKVPQSFIGPVLKVLLAVSDSSNKRTLSLQRSVALRVSR